MSSPLLNSQLNSKHLNLFSCSVLISSYLFLRVGLIFPQSCLGPREIKDLFFFFEDTGSVPTGQTVGTKVISFLAIGMFPKLPIGKFQVFGIFISCALDPIHSSWNICLASSVSSFLTLFDLHVGKVHIVI